MSTAPVTPPPPELPELPEGARRFPAWPPWFALVGFVVGLAGTLVAVGVVAGLLSVAGVDSDSSAFVIVGTLVQGMVFLATAIFFASRIERPRAWHFGLRGTPFWPALGWSALAMFSFYFVTAIYAVAVQPDAEQGTVEALGGDEGTLGLVLAGLMVIVVAPVVEEIFFRGFFYRALRTRLGIAAAAIIDGLLFGVIHFNFEGADGLLLLPPLAFLGVLFCLVYEKTGSLLPVIALHAFNNAVAYGVQADGGWLVSVIVGPLVLIGCVLAPRLLPRSPLPAGA